MSGRRHDTPLNTHRVLDFSGCVLSFCLKLDGRRLCDDALHRHLDEFIETVELLADETLVVEISINDDPTRLLPELIGNFLIFFIVEKS